MAARVLYIGIEPSLVDLSVAPPGTTAEMLMKGISSVVQQLNDSGYEAHWCPVDRGETAEAVVTKALAERSVDCIVIGAGIRLGAPYFLLFEKLLNVVHQQAPRAKICFNATPADTLEAVQRWVPNRL
jgi:hypothetical protein